MNRIKQLIQLSFFLLLSLLPGLLWAQENAGDVWCVVPQGVQPGEQFAFEIHINSGDKNVSAYGFDVYLDFRYYEMDTSEVSYGIEVGKDGYLSVKSPGVSFFICQGFDPSGTGPGSNLHFLTFHCTAKEKGISVIEIAVKSLYDSSTNPIGTPRGIPGLLTIGSNGIAGDVNQSGDISIVDALLVAQYYTYQSITVAIDTSVSDVNLDGNIDIVDALLIAQYYVGLIGPLPFSGTPGPPVPTPTPEEEATPTPAVASFADPVLEAEIRNLLMLPAGEVTYVSDVENIERLNFYNKNIIHLDGIEYLVSLTELRLNSNNISDVTPLSNCTQLTLLSLGANNISDITPLANLTNLQELYLYVNNISDINIIENLTNLVHLNMHTNNISDINPLINCIMLNYLHLSNNNISNINTLFYLTQLEDIRLENNPILQEDIDALTAAFPDATILY